MSDEIRFKILKTLADNPDVSQRELAEHMEASLAVKKINFVQTCHALTR